MSTNIPDTPAESTTTLSRSPAGKLRPLSGRVAALLSSTQIATASCESSNRDDVVCALACMLAGVTSMCVSRDAVEMGLYTAEDLCKQHGVDPAVYVPMIASFRKQSPAIRVFPPEF
jgi:hypothetical protein